MNSRSGYRRREWDTRAGTIELAIPKLRQGSYFPGFLEHRRRAELPLASVVATSYLLGVSTRRVEKLAASLGVIGLSKWQVSAMSGELDDLVDGFRNRPLDRGQYTFCWIDALTRKVREGSRTVNVHCLIVTGVNALPLCQLASSQLLPLCVAELCPSWLKAARRCVSAALP